MAFSKKQLLALCAVALIALIVFFSYGSWRQPSGATPTPSVSASVLGFNASYAVSGSSVSFSEKVSGKVSGGGGFSEEVALTNEGASAARFGFLDVIPSSLSEGAAFDAVSGKPPAATEFLSLDPLMRYLIVSLEGGEAFVSRFSAPRPAEEHPVHFFVSPDLAEEEKRKLADLGSAIASLGLSETEAREFEKRLNAGYSVYEKSGYRFDDFMAAARVFTANVGVARRVAIMQGESAEDFSKEIKQIVLPPPLPTPTPLPSALVPSFPEEFVVSVSEGEPINSSEFAIPTTRYFGELLVKFEGAAAEYARGETDFPGGEYLLTISADLSDVELEDCFFPFDELDGYAEFMFLSLPGTIARVPFRIEVNHFNVCEDLEKNDLVSADGSFDAESAKTEEDDAALGKLTENVFGTEAVWGWPAEGKIISVWGDCREGCTRRHQGIDIQAPEGDLVYAIDEGVVEVARNYEVSKAISSWRCGKYVRVKHLSGEKSVYCHLSRVDVIAGERISKCSVLGAVGRTGNAASTPPHLHFEIRKTDGKPTNPRPLLGKKADYCVAQT